MDSITQAALGAAVGGTVLGRRLGRKAVLIGAVLGTLPDLDVVIDYGDAVANVTEHRGFSHSLFVLTGIGTLLALLTSRLTSAREIPLGHWWLFYVLCLTTHPLLDALTTYGTQLWWPMDVRPAAYPIVFIIDPLYTLPLLIGIGVALATGNGRRGAELEEAALASERGARLDWFAGPFLRYETRVLDGQETLVATDLRLGLPGFHPFAFTLAIREGGDWQPVAVSEQLEPTSRGNREALSRLAGRALSPRSALCTSEFVAAGWVREGSERC